MSATLNIFVTGATGYIGGCVVARLLKHPKAASFQITALVRSNEKAEKLHTLGIKTIMGSYADKNSGFLTEAASKADVVFAIADNDNLAAAEAILDGLKLRFEKTGKTPILIHTSGTAIINDDARGQHSNHKTYSDLETETLNAIPVTALHRNVDIPIVEADKAGYVKTYIITPGTVFGSPSGPLVDLKVQNEHSQQIPYFIKPSIARKQGAYIGKGLSTWSAVDVEDTADLFLVVFDVATSGSTAVGHGAEGYYFVENFLYSGLEVAQKISEALVELGIGSTREPSAFSQEELEKNFGPFWPLLSTNSHAQADRGRALGWVPKRSTKEAFLANVKEEVAFYAREQGPLATVVEIVTFKASEVLLANPAVADSVLEYFKKALGVLR
ncbi:NAD(P)-binding protein [Pholiota conissans]|uniref:NAD(P)-binding protein n=1 Tax=Pholiota conissans TaxID=109636 RepID=A0A9P5ZFP7_9AGAR|nr:NAD(P)-binding protein [Pholiota conissans]